MYFLETPHPQLFPSMVLQLPLSSPSTLVLSRCFTTLMDRSDMMAVIWSQHSRAPPTKNVLSGTKSYMVSSSISDCSWSDAENILDRIDIWEINSCAIPPYLCQLFWRLDEPTVDLPLYQWITTPHKHGKEAGRSYSLPWNKSEEETCVPTRLVTFCHRDIDFWCAVSMASLQGVFGEEDRATAKVRILGGEYHRLLNPPEVWYFCSLGLPCCLAPRALANSSILAAWDQ